MHSGPVQDAKARFSELLVAVEQWRRMHAASRPSLKALLLDDADRADMLLPTRGRARRRRIDPSG